MQAILNDIKSKKMIIVIICEILLILAVHMWNINGMHSFFLSEDELGYWGNAAFLLGKDWGNTMSYSSYYSYGYSFFLMLIMSLPIQPLVMYRLAIVANAMFMILSFLISFYVFTQLFPKKNYYLISIACSCMALYVSYVSWSCSAWAENYLVLFVWIAILLTYLVCKKPTTIRIIIFVIELGYLYMIHQRTVPFMIAGIVLGFCLMIKKKINVRQLLIMLVVAISMFVLAEGIKDFLQGAIYGAGKLANDYSSISSSFSVSNMITPVIRAVLGQIYYLWMASFGLIPLGIGLTIRNIIKKWNDKNSDSLFYLFIVLAFVGLLGVSSIFMRLGVGRLDQLIYGRYNEIAVGFFIIMGIVELSDFVVSKYSLQKLLIAVASSFILALMLINKIQSWNIDLTAGYQGVCATGMFWFYQFRGFKVLELCAIVAIVEIVIFVFAKKFVKNPMIIGIEAGVIAFFWVFASQAVIDGQIRPYQTRQNEDMVVNKSEVWETIKQNSNEVVFLTTKPKGSQRGVIQFNLFDFPLLTTTELAELEKMPEILIVDGNGSTIPQQYYDNYSLACYLGKTSVYTANGIELGYTSEEIDDSVFYYKDIMYDDSGYVMYGPYMSLESGNYEVTFYMNAIDKSNESYGQFDVSSMDKVISSEEYYGDNDRVTLHFTLKEPTDNIEFRYMKYIGNETCPISVTLSRIDE